MARAAATTEQVRADVPVISVDPGEGLNRDQVEERRQGGWSNVQVKGPTKTEGQVIRSHVLTYFNLIFLILAAVLVAVGEYKNATFFLIAVINTIIGIVQELRSKRTVDKLTLLAAPRGKVIRSGDEMSIPVDHMVRDDIAVLSAGDQIPADALVREGTVTVNESMISGEAEPVEKGPGAKLRSGAFVVSGSCKAQLTAVGPDSYAARLTLEAKKDPKSSQSEMMASLSRLIRVIGITLIPVGGVLFWKQYFLLHLPLNQAVSATVAALIGMIPEGLFLLTSVALTVSVLRLAQRKVLCQDMNCVETLARVDVLCVDKTGTITEPEMLVQDVVLLDEEEYPAPAVEEAMAALCRALKPDNDTGRALAARFDKGGEWTFTAALPFTSQTKYQAAVFEGRGTVVAGAPEFVMGAHYSDLKEMVEPWSAKGYRVLLAAGYDGVPESGAPLDGRRVRPMALILLTNRIRPQAPDTFAYFARQRVAVKVISGDNPMTVSEIARQAGVENADKWVDAATLQTDEAIYEAAGTYTVFGRVTPGQKRKLIKSLQRQGHTVAMTGDGVNDVLALKDADCGIAMVSGSEAACRAANLVLMESDFSCLPQVVAEGRRVINNIQRSASLYLVKNIFSFLLALITLFVDMPYPLVPIQLSLISALTIGFPSFVLALEPNEERVRGKFMFNVLREAAPGGFTNLIIILGLQAFAAVFGFPTRSLSTMSALCVALVGLMVLYQVCKPLDRKRWVLWGGCTAAMAAAVLLLGGFFSLTPLDLRETMVLLVFLALCWPVMKSLLTIFFRGRKLYRRLRRRWRERKAAEAA